MNRKKTVGLFLFAIVSSVVLLGACTTPKESAVKEVVVPNEKPTTSEEKNSYLFENEAFRIHGIDPSEDGTQVTIYGNARVYEANINYTVENGHSVLKEGYVTASTAAPEWGAFELSVKVDPAQMGYLTVYHIILYEENAEDGTMRHQIAIPMEIKTQPAITGKILEINEGRFLVNSSANEKDLIWFTSNQTEDLQVGQTVSVWASAIRESYPAQADATKVQIHP